MAANADPNLSTITTDAAAVAAAAAPLESLPIANVYESANSVTVRWGDDFSTSDLHRADYTNDPYHFHATHSTGREPFVKTFGSLLGCNGGILIIGQERYRIQVQQQQQQQQPVIPLAYQPVVEFAKQQMDKHTEGRAFSKAGYTWARLLLSERGIQVRTNEINLEDGQGAEPQRFHWTVETNENEVLRPGEHYRTKDAKSWFLQNFLPSDDIFDLKVVTGSPLPELRGHTKKANGQSDLVIGKKAELQIAPDPYDFAFGLIELKQDIYDINKGQNVLELASLATISRVGKNSSLLATDCNTKWELYWFEDERTIVRGVYRSGRKCFEDFRRLLMDAESRVLRPPSKQSRLVLPHFEEHDEDDPDDDEQNLDGFDAQDPKTKALERQGQLNALADYLGDLYCVRPCVPSWAMAENTCPDYYA